MINQSAIDRGFFRSVFFRCYNDRASETEKIRNVNTQNTTRLTHGKYDKLDHDGLICPGTKFSGDDIIIGKVVEPS